MKMLNPAERTRGKQKGNLTTSEKSGLLQLSFSRG